MSQDVKIENLIINRLTQEQYDEIESPDPNQLYMIPETPASEDHLGPVKVDGETIKIDENGVISAEKEGEKPYLSLERNGDYLYTVTFDTIPEKNGDGPAPIGGCSSFVRGGKLFRNLDWNYDNTASFHVITKDFEGMSFVGGLNDGELDDAKIAQLPYRITDGVNKHGIMVSTHVLYNDWNWVGSGTTALTELPFQVLTHVKSMDTIATDLAEILPDLYVPEAMQETEYLIQVLVTDGETTYILTPPTTASGTYTLVDATSNPKLTNFRWVADATVVRTNLQTRPTGVERWNLIGNDTELEDLRFTLAYEAPNKLSEFIGRDGTTKDSTDTELTAIYNEAHAEYEDRERDGKTWQTVHSVVYGTNGIENLYVQEDWKKDYTYATKDTMDSRIGEILTGTPTEATVGTLGQIRSAVVSGVVSVYVCTAIDDTDPTDIKYTWDKVALASDTPETKASVDPMLKAMVVPDSTSVGDEELDMFGLTAEVEDDVLRI